MAPQSSRLLTPLSSSDGVSAFLLFSFTPTGFNTCFGFYKKWAQSADIKCLIMEALWLTGLLVVGNLSLNELVLVLIVRIWPHYITSVKRPLFQNQPGLLGGWNFYRIRYFGNFVKGQMIHLIICLVSSLVPQCFLVQILPRAPGYSLANSICANVSFEPQARGCKNISFDL